MNATSFYIGSPRWEQALSDIRELLGESEMSEVEVRNLIAFDIPTLLTKLINTLNSDIPVSNCLPTWNNLVVIKFPTVKPETDDATIEAIVSKTLQLSNCLNVFNPEISYVIAIEFRDSVMFITLNKELR